MKRVQIPKAKGRKAVTRYVPSPGTTPWRVGKKVGRTLYDCEGRLVGIVDTPDMATLVIEAVNAYWGNEVEPEVLPCGCDSERRTKCSKVEKESLCLCYCHRCPPVRPQARGGATK